MHGLLLRLNLPADRGGPRPSSVAVVCMGVLSCGLLATADYVSLLLVEVPFGRVT